MKPIILVIVGASMLMPMMRYHNTHNPKELRKNSSRRLEQFQKKQDSETNMHNTGLWIERLP